MKFTSFRMEDDADNKKSADVQTRPKVRTQQEKSQMLDDQ
jgi:hypothetical protein